jgi:hypothetical protein
MMEQIQKVLHMLLTINEFGDDQQMNETDKEIMSLLVHNTYKNDEELKVK